MSYNDAVFKEVMILSLRSIASPYMTRQSFNVFLVGLSSGIPFLLTTNILDIWLKTEGVSNTVIGAFALLHFPYALKFLLGPITDKIKFPFFCEKFGQRRGWAIVSQLALLFMLMGIAFSPPGEKLPQLILFVLLSSLANGVQDITLYTFQFDKINRKDYGVIASIVIIGYRIGMFIAKSSVLYIAYYFSWKTAYITMACSIILGITFVLTTHEPVILSTREEEKVQRLIWRFKEKNKYTNKTFTYNMSAVFFECLIFPLKLFLKNKNWQLYILLILFYRAGDILTQKMAKVFYIELGFSTLEIANVVQVFGSISALIGGIGIGYFIKNSSLEKCMLWTAVLHAFAGFSMLILMYTGNDTSYLYLIVFVEFTTGSAMSACFLSFLYSLCKTGSPTTQYSLLWAIHETIGTIVRSFSGTYVDAAGWKTFFITTPLLFVPGILILAILIKRNGEINE